MVRENNNKRSNSEKVRRERVVRQKCTERNQAHLKMIEEGAEDERCSAREGTR